MSAKEAGGLKAWTGQYFLKLIQLLSTARAGEQPSFPIDDLPAHSGRRKKQQLTALLALNRREMKAYLLKEYLGRLGKYHYGGTMLRSLQSWMDSCAGSGSSPWRSCQDDHGPSEGILNYCRTKFQWNSSSYK